MYQNQSFSLPQKEEWTLIYLMIISIQLLIWIVLGKKKNGCKSSDSRFFLLNNLKNEKSSLSWLCDLNLPKKIVVICGGGGGGFNIMKRYQQMINCLPFTYVDWCWLKGVPPWKLIIFLTVLVYITIHTFIKVADSGSFFIITSYWDLQPDHQKNNFDRHSGHLRSMMPVFFEDFRGVSLWFRVEIIV